MSCSALNYIGINNNNHNFKTKKEKNQNIQVVVRCRPLNVIERRSGGINLVDVQPDRKEVNIREKVLPTAPVKTYNFDRVFGPESKQVDVYKQVVMPIVDEVLTGYNCTIFAYGQTGTGKTYTMEGDRIDEVINSWREETNAGIIPRVINHMFTKLQEQCVDFTVRVSYLEIYNEEFIDLLKTGEGPKPSIRVYEDNNKKGGCILMGLEEVVVNNMEEVFKVLQRGSFKRQTAPTLMNIQSSRSHALFMITIRIKEETIDGEELLKIGKLNLVDLAGSESIGRSGAQEKRAREAGNINQSLLTLGRVINALVDHAPHVPYRESKLTRILQDSLGGRTKTSIIATISPSSSNLDETLSTLDYAYRAKNITNKPEVNQKMTKKALFKEYKDEIDKLKKDLDAARGKSGFFIDKDNYEFMQQKIFEQKEMIREQEERLLYLVQDIEKVNELYGQNQTKLYELQNSLQRTIAKKEALEEKLMRTRIRKDQFKELMQEYKDVELLLFSQSNQLLNQAFEMISDIEQLHNKLDRTKTVEKINEQKRVEFIRQLDSVENVCLQKFKERIDLDLLFTHTANEHLEICKDEVKAVTEQLVGLECIIKDHLNISQNLLGDYTNTIVNTNKLLAGGINEKMCGEISRINIANQQAELIITKLKDSLESVKSNQSRLQSKINDYYEGLNFDGIMQVLSDHLKEVKHLCKGFVGTDEKQKKVKYEKMNQLALKKSANFEKILELLRKQQDLDNEELNLVMHEDSVSKNCSEEFNQNLIVMENKMLSNAEVQVNNILDSVKENLTESQKSLVTLEMEEDDQIKNILLLADSIQESNKIVIKNCNEHNVEISTVLNNNSEISKKNNMMLNEISEKLENSVSEVIKKTENLQLDSINCNCQSLIKKIKSWQVKACDLSKDTLNFELANGDQVKKLLIEGFDQNKSTGLTPIRKNYSITENLAKSRNKDEILINFPIRVSLDDTVNSESPLLDDLDNPDPNILCPAIVSFNNETDKISIDDTELININPMLQEKEKEVMILNSAKITKRPPFPSHENLVLKESTKINCYKSEEPDSMPRIKFSSESNADLKFISNGTETGLDYIETLKSLENISATQPQPAVNNERIYQDGENVKPGNNSLKPMILRNRSRTPKSRIPTGSSTFTSQIKFKNKK